MNTVSRDHVELGVAGGFTQAGHGRASGLKRLTAGDWLVFYSPKTSLQDGDRLQAFTAIGRVQDAAPYQVELSPDSCHGGGMSDFSSVCRRRSRR